MDSKGVFYQQPNASRRCAAESARSHSFQRFIQQGQVREHGLDDQRQVWLFEGRLHRRLPGSQGRAGRRLHELRSRLLCRLLPVLWPGTAYDNNLTSKCYSPSATWFSNERNTHQQHEFRLSTPEEQRVAPSRVVFWEANKLYDQSGWNYKNVPSCTTDDPAGTGGNSGCFSDIGTAPGATVVNPGVQPSNLSFYQDTVRETKQLAFFASIDFDIIPKVLTVTAVRATSGFRTPRRASVTGSFGCFEQGVPAGGVSSTTSISTRRICATRSRASRAVAISPGTSRPTRWCITRSRRVSGRAASTRTAVLPTPPDRTAWRNTSSPARTSPTS